MKKRLFAALLLTLIVSAGTSFAQDGGKLCTIFVADYNADNTLKSVRIIKNHTYTTDDGVRIAAGLMPGQRAFVWDSGMRPVTGVIKYESFGDNDFADTWEY